MLMDSELLNLDALQELENSTRPELLRRVVGIFVQETTHKIQLMITAGQINDWQRLQCEAHALKSSAGMLGAQHLQAHAQQLDNACLQGDLEQAQALVDSIGTVANQALEALTHRYLD